MIDPATVDGSSVRLRRRGSGADVPAAVDAEGSTVTLDPDADLDAEATYDVTVAGSIEDAAGNPLGADDGWKFTVGGPPVGLVDTTAADFSAGDPGSGAYVADEAGGEVTLRPAVGEEFRGGPGLPAGWSSGNGAPWTGGSATLAGGSIHVDGAFASTDATFGPGRVLEFEGALGAAPFQHAGLTADSFQSDLYAMFSTGSTSNEVRARTNFGAGESSLTVPGVTPDVSHRYRIEWDAGEVRYYVDGGLVATHSGSFGVDLRPTLSDLGSGGPELALGWLRMGPYPGSGSFDSRILDAGQATDWGALSWVADAPAGTGVELSVRTGDTATPDGSWSGFTPVASGGEIPGNSRYVQYRATLTSGDPARSPVLEEVAISGSEDIAPTAVDDEVTVAQDAGPTPIDVLANDTDPDGGPFEIFIVASVPGSAHGTILVDPDGKGLTYEPDPGYCNSSPGDPPASFGYTLNGGSTARRHPARHRDRRGTDRSDQRSDPDLRLLLRRPRRELRVRDRQRRLRALRLARDPRPAGRRRSHLRRPRKGRRRQRGPDPGQPQLQGRHGRAGRLDLLPAGAGAVADLAGQLHDLRQRPRRPRRLRRARDPRLDGLHPRHRPRPRDQLQRPLLHRPVRHLRRGRLGRSGDRRRPRPQPERVRPAAGRDR
ncbi:MAG: hypothetical protein EDQ89_11420, partial [Acidobacteria bacterium]